MNTITRCVVIMSVIFIAGCSSARKVTLEGGKKINLAELLPGEKAFEGDNPEPEWIRVPSKNKYQKPDVEYFVGTSLPLKYKPAAVEGAYDECNKKIGSYLTSFLDKRNTTVNSQNSSTTTYGVDVTVANKAVAEHISKIVFHGQYGVEEYTQHLVVNENGAIQRYYIVSELFELPKSEMVRVLSTNIERVQQEVAQQRDEPKKEVLKAQVSIYEALKNKILGKLTQ